MDSKEMIKLEQQLRSNFKKCRDKVQKEKEKQELLSRSVAEEEDDEEGDFRTIQRKKHPATPESALRFKKLDEELRAQRKQEKAKLRNTSKEKEFEFKPITDALDKVDEDLIKTLKQLVPVSRKQYNISVSDDKGHFVPAIASTPVKRPLQLEMDRSPSNEPEDSLEDTMNVSANSVGEADPIIKSIIDRSEQVQTNPDLAVSKKGVGAIARLYILHPDKKFGIHAEGDMLFIGDKPVQIDGNDIIMSNVRYKGTHGLWKLLTIQSGKKVPSEDDYTENDFNSYKEIIIKSNTMYQNNNPNQPNPKSGTSIKWKTLISPIWKEYMEQKKKKVGSGVLKYTEAPVEYKYFDNLNQLVQRLYYIYAQEKAGNNNFHNEKIGVINAVAEMLKKSVDSPQGIELLIKVLTRLPSGILKQGSGIVDLLNLLPFEMHWPGYNYLGPNTKLEKRQKRGDKPINKLDKAAMEHDIFYNDHASTKDRHKADHVLEHAAWERVKAPDANLKEKAAAYVTTNAMKIKRHLGWGF